jgi:hypothetical protein
MTRSDILALTWEWEEERQRCRKIWNESPGSELARYVQGKANGLNQAIKALLAAEGIADLRPDRSDF